MKDAFCSPALPRGSRLWEPVRASFPGSIADARAHTREREHSGACVRAHACPPAPCCLPPAHRLLTFMSQEQRGGLSPTVALQLHAGQRRLPVLPGFCQPPGQGSQKTLPLPANLPHVYLETRSAAPALDFVTTLLRLSSSPALKSEQGACESVKSAERKSFLTYLLHGGDVAHGKPLSLSSPPSSTMCLAPAACPPRCPQAPAEVPQPQVYC